VGRIIPDVRGLQIGEGDQVGVQKVGFAVPGVLEEPGHERAEVGGVLGNIGKMVGLPREPIGRQPEGLDHQGVEPAVMVVAFIAAAVFLALPVQAQIVQQTPGPERRRGVAVAQIGVQTPEGQGGRGPRVIGSVGEAVFRKIGGKGPAVAVRCAVQIQPGQPVVQNGPGPGVIADEIKLGQPVKGPILPQGVAHLRVGAAVFGSLDDGPAAGDFSPVQAPGVNPDKVEGPGKIAAALFHRPRYRGLASGAMAVP
jgi:hypothetical protein